MTRRNPFARIQLALVVLAVFAGALAAAPSRALAQRQSDATAPGFTDIGEDDATEDPSLYSCAKGRISSVWVNLKPETELKDLLEWAMTFTCKNFVYSSGIGSRSAKVTIMAPKQMSPQQAWRVFLVSLQTMNLTVVPKGNVLEIIESPRAKEQPLPVFSPGSAPVTDQVMRVVVRPEHISVDDLAAAMNALKSRDGIISPLPNAGIIVVTDYGSVIRRMVDITRQIDEPVGDEDLYIIKVNYADATELATKLQEIFGQSGGSSAPPPPTSRRSARSRRAQAEAAPEATQRDVSDAVPSKLMADDRTNVLILMANEAAYTRVASLVKYLDVQVEGGAGRIQVYYLENAEAEEIAGTLNGVISGIEQPSGQGAQTRRAPSVPALAGAGTEAFEGQVRVTHDKATNSLVIVASVKDFLSLRDVIRRLDVARRQVYIEATIFEVSLDNSRRIGASFHGGDLQEVGGKDSLTFGGSLHGELSTVNFATGGINVGTPAGLIAGIVGPELDGVEQLLGVSIPSFGVLFQALANTNDLNILSAPHLIATANEEAEISVGNNIPYQGAFSGIGGAAGQAAGGFSIPNVSVQRQDVALTLKITPQINASGRVRLEIDQEISDIKSDNFNNLGPIWSKRTLKTTVVVGDQQTVVIGGLIEDKETATESKVPLLGDIPILGYLFRFSRKSKQKTNLLILLTPYVIKDDSDLQRIAARKMRERREFIDTFTTFDSFEYDPDTDYRRKRGVVEEVNQAVMTAEREAELLREYERQVIEYPQGPVRYGTPDLEPGEPLELDAPPAAATDAPPAAATDARPAAATDALPAAATDAPPGAAGAADDDGATDGDDGATDGDE